MKYIVLVLVVCLMVVCSESMCFAQYASPYGNPYNDYTVPSYNNPNSYNFGTSSYADPHPWNSDRVDIIVHDNNTGETRIVPGEYSRDGRYVYGYDGDKTYIESAPRSRY